jgi:hypothetical protein
LSGCAVYDSSCLADLANVRQLVSGRESLLRGLALKVDATACFLTPVEALPLNAILRVILDILTFEIRDTIDECYIELCGDCTIPAFAVEEHLVFPKGEANSFPSFYRNLFILTYLSSNTISWLSIFYFKDYFPFD